MMVEPTVRVLHPEVPCAHPAVEAELFAGDDLVHDVDERFWPAIDDEPPDVVA